MDFWSIYDEYYERVKRFIGVVVKDPWAAEDLIQETFVKVQNSIASHQYPWASMNKSNG